MKKHIVGVCALGLVVFLAACDPMATTLSDSERLDAFLETANDSTRDYDEMRSHFSDTADDYSSMNTSGYWEATIFELANQQFSVTGQTSGGSVSGYGDSTSITGTFTSGVVSGDIVFVFVEDGSVSGNRVIRAINYNSNAQVLDNRID